MSNIINVIGREVIDSRGNPTVEAEVYTKSGFRGLAAVPSGSSVGSREALELRDKDNSRFFGKGVKKAISFINGPIKDALFGMNITHQDSIDKTMIDLDGTNNKSKLGANSILSVSLAAAKASANFKQIPLYEYIAELYGRPKDKYSIPLPMMNIVNGGRHANNNLDIQEFMIMPIGAKTIKEAVRMGSEISYILGRVLKNKGIPIQIGDEGGYAPNVASHDIVLELIREAITQSNYAIGKDVVLSIDCAASEFFDVSVKKYYLKSENMHFSSEDFTNYLLSLIQKYPIISIEDGQSEDDWVGFAYHTKILGCEIQLVGDDIFVTNENLLKMGINRNVANAILIKPNQIGSLTETLQVIKIAQEARYNTIISHRSGETEDTSIVDIAIGTSAGQIKTGPVRCSERVAKYNRLIRIEENLGKKGVFNGIKEIKYI